MGSRGQASLSGDEAMTLRVRLLGGFDLSLGDEPVPPLDSRRAESLLAYLLLHRDAPQPRQRLAFLLWPDSTESQARTNLRHVLHNLRRALPQADMFIDARPRTLRWRPDAPVWVDVAAFEEAVAAGHLADAVETYRGHLLEGSYDDWVLEERERLEQLHLEALVQLALDLEEQGRVSEAVRCAERLVRQDPLREETYQLLMRLYEASGDRARALRTYHVCVSTLQRELGVEASVATRTAYEALLPVMPETMDAPTSTTIPALVGRTTERARLAALWRTAEEGSAQLALVTGEPGVGKSRLVEELRTWCAQSGATTVEARAYPAEGAMAYGALVTWLRSDVVATRLRRLHPAHLTELARLLPELLVEIPDLPSPEPLPEDAQRQRLHEAAVRAILGAGSPLLMVADDVQWCDAQTLQFIHYLLRAEPGVPLLVAATARREDVDRGHPLDELVAGLQALGRYSEIPLARLARGETKVLAERISGGHMDEREADRLFEESEGNPLFVIETLRAGTVPEARMRVQSVIAGRLARLSEPAAELLGLAATIGREFTTDVLAEASGIPDAVLVHGLDELWRRGLVRAHGANAYDFSHGKIRETAYAALGPARARHHHLGIARALERRGGPDAIGRRIAAHYDAAGAVGEAIAWYERSAEAAGSLYAAADAARSLERALELLVALPAGSERDVLELRLLTALPAPLVSVEGYLSARVAEVHARALELVAALGVDGPAPLIRSLALATLTRGGSEAARPYGEQLRRRAEHEGDDVLWVESAYVLGLVDYWSGRLEAARACFQDVVDRYRPERRSEHVLRYGQDPRVFCQMRLAHTLWLLGCEDEAERARDEALAVAGQIGHSYSRAGALVFASLLSIDQHDGDRIRRYTHELGSDPSLYEARPTRAAAESLAGYVDVLDGRTERGLGRMRQALDEARDGRAAAPGLLGLLARLLVEACAAAGEAKLGLEAADRALESGGGAQLWEAEIRRRRAGFLGALDAASAEVEAELQRALEVARQQDARPFEDRIREDLRRLRIGTR